MKPRWTRIIALLLTAVTLAVATSGAAHAARRCSAVSAVNGPRLVAEYNAAGTTILRRYVPGPGTDEALVWYEGSGLTDRRSLHTDERGSVFAWSTIGGAITAAQTQTYDPYGAPASWGGPRYAYDGQIAIPEAQLYFYKSRFYDPVSGHFLQTDPIGYAGGANLYAYVSDDPTDLTDPTGWKQQPGPANAGFEVARRDIYNTEEQNALEVANPGVNSNTGVIGADNIVGPVTAAESGALSPFTRRYLTESGGRWGGTATRQQNYAISQELTARDYTFGDRPGGGLGSEEYISGPGGGSSGGTYVDITATAPNGRTVRIQTVTTLSDGVTPTPSEAAAAARIRAAFPNDKLLLVPKRGP